MKGGRKDAFDSILERKNHLLVDMQMIDVKEEEGLIEEEDQANRQFL